MVYRYLTDLAEIARSANLRTTEIDGWRKRGRPASTGEFDPDGVMCHHTGGKGDRIDTAEWLAKVGRPDEGIPAPLCQLALNRSGIVYVCAAGRANHAGEVEAWGEWLHPGDGNAQTVGIEAMNTGAEGWSDDQYDAYVRLVAALCDAYGWRATHVVAHKEAAPDRKIDPGKMNMDRFRDAVRQRLRTTEEPMPGPDPQPPTWQRKIKRLDQPERDQPDELGAGVMLAQTHDRAGDARAFAREAATATQVEDLESLVRRTLSSAQIAATRAGTAIHMLGGTWRLDPDGTPDGVELGLGEIALPPEANRGTHYLAEPTELEPLELPSSSSGSMRHGEYRKATGAAATTGLVGVLAAAAQAWIAGGLDTEQTTTFVASIVTAIAATFGVTFARANRTPAEIDARKAVRGERRRRRRNR